MKRIFFVIILLALTLGACSPAGTNMPATPTSSGSATTFPSSVPTNIPATPLPTLPDHTPAPTQKSASTATPAPSPSAQASNPNITPAAPDCSAFPGIPACGASLALSGKLAILDGASQVITVLDFNAKQAWKMTAPPQAQRLVWMDGNFLLAYDNQDQPSLVWADPANPGSFHLPQPSPQGAPVFKTADGSTAWIDVQDTQYYYHVRLGQNGPEQVWPAGQPGDEIHQILGWVPGAPLLLAGYHFSGNSMWVTGDRLYTLNPANGEIKEMDANLRLGGSFQWHPSQTGLMVFGDSNQSPVMGAPRLATLDVISGKVTHLIGDGEVSSSYPSWTSDGTAILHAASKVGEPPAANDPFALPAIYLTQYPEGTTRRLTDPPEGAHDDWPHLLADGTRFFYLRIPEGQPVELRLGALEGSQDALIANHLGTAPSLPVGPGWDALVAYAP